MKGKQLRENDIIGCGDSLKWRFLTIFDSRNLKVFSKNPYCVCICILYLYFIKNDYSMCRTDIKEQTDIINYIEVVRL